MGRGVAGRGRVVGRGVSEHAARRQLTLVIFLNRTVAVSERRTCKAGVG